MSGGSIPEFIGETLVWTIDSRGVHLPPIRRVSNTLTLISGATGHLTSHGTLDIVVPELVGETFRLTNIPMNIVTSKGNKVVGRLRAAEDFPAKVNLTFEGVFNAGGATAPPFAADLSLRGVICP